ncbi:hypothetical protein [Ferrimonas lipolytica]|uniref:L,D-transpeptidase catalytic domain n=1 Tax=Ferrimonas lipolytica TaxID=2724191 RepID=A0A6H1UBK8_9GAMM|nr:hypothetical protein [Ferrimonas lipolytica]QIZ75753.1 hypothetical protein HER31_01860 [Ferrimonas lipolytica]
MNKKQIKILAVVASSFISTSVFASDAEILKLGPYTGLLWPDGSGVIGKPYDVEKFKDRWSFLIKVDEMNDDQEITVDRKAYKNTDEFGKIRLSANIYLWLNISKAEEEILCVAGHDYPGKKAMIRVDKHDPIETNVSGCVALDDELDSLLKGGTKITIRGYHWPYGGAETFQIDLAGYTTTIDFLRGKRRE